jgi:hypothetical protein
MQGAYMKRIFSCGLLLFFLFMSPFASAGGGITHMFIAQETIAQIPDPTLRSILSDNLDAYMVGAYYPDSGYVQGAEYGEDSHWDPFIFAFADYIKDTYPDAINTHPKLVAFLFGCAVHRVSDEVMHWGFYPLIRDHDFNGDGKTAHTYGDLGIDLLVIVDKSQWFTAPSSWWVPMDDLVAVYQRMGKPQYDAQQIEKGMSVISVAGLGERLIAEPAYPYLSWKMPWTKANYDDWPETGIRGDELQVVDYEMKLWQRLQSRANEKPTPALHSAHLVSPNWYASNFAQLAIKNKLVELTVHHHADGSLSIENPVIKEGKKFHQLLDELATKVTG